MIQYDTMLHSSRAHVCAVANVTSPFSVRCCTIDSTCNGGNQHGSVL